MDEKPPSHGPRKNEINGWNRENDDVIYSICRINLHYRIKVHTNRHGSEGGTLFREFLFFTIQTLHIFGKAVAATIYPNSYKTNDALSIDKIYSILITWEEKRNEMFWIELLNTLITFKRNIFPLIWLNFLFTS